MQEASTRKDFWYTTIRTLPFLIIAVLVPQFAYRRGFEDMNPLHVINVTSDTFGMLMGCMILIGLYLDKQKTGKITRLLAAIVIVAFVGLLTDAIEYITDGVPNYRLFNICVTTIYYVTTPAQAILFWHYTLNYLKVKVKSLVQINGLIFIGFVIAVSIRLANLSYGFYYTINEMGVYARGPMYGWSKLYFVVVTLLTLAIIIAERKQLKTVQLIAVFLFAIGPISAGLLSIVIHGLSLTPITTMISTLFMYCALNVTQGREMAVAENEISIASSIQENVLPKVFPYLPERKEFDLYAIMRPAREVGGDFYDFFMVDDDHLALVIADVSGKGIPAALFMMTSRTLIKNRVQAGGNLSDIMREVNNQLCEGNVADLFVTVWIGIIDLTTGKGVAVNAGHEHPVLRRAGENYELVIYPHSFAVAFLEDSKFEVHEFKLNPGDSIFVYTDGVTEAMNENEELYTKERLVDTLNHSKDSSPKETIDNVLNAIGKFVNGAEQFDDITMLCLTYHGMLQESS